MKRFLFGLAFIAFLTALLGRRSRKAPRQPSVSSHPERPTYDEIALRAYFIGLDHDVHGDQPDPLRDWVEAEYELIASRR